jgi:hypothetical protein
MKTKNKYIKVLYKDKHSTIRYNSFFGIYSIKTPTGVICITEEVLGDLKKDKGLSKVLKELDD